MNEIQINIGIRITKGLSYSVPVVQAFFNMAGTKVIQNAQDITNSATGDFLELGGVTNPGFAYFSNIGAETIEVGYEDTGVFKKFLELEAGQSCTSWLGQVAPKAKRAAGASTLAYIIADR